MAEPTQMQTQTPPRVRRGDQVAIVAPAGPVQPARLAAGLALLDGRYRLQVAEDIARRSGYLAGSDEQRADELNRAFRDPDVRAVILARGGYGIQRILPLLDAGALAADPKPIVGFSDGTALLAWAERAAGVRSIHGPVVVQLPKLSPADVAWLCDLLEGSAEAGPGTCFATSLDAFGAAATGVIQGRLIGGNLTLVSHLVATRWAPDPSGAIFLLEEVDEKPYAIDRHLTTMLQSGALDGAAGAIVGDFTLCDDDKYPEISARAVLDERLRAAAIPCLAGVAVGHGPRNRAVPYGGQVALDFERCSVTLLDPACV